MFQRKLRRSLQIKNIIAHAPLCVLLCTATAYKQQLCTATACKGQTNIQLRQRQLFTYQDTSRAAKKITADILHKAYTEKGAITVVLSTVEVRKEFTYFQMATDARCQEGGNQLYGCIVTLQLTPFEDDAEIR